MLNLILAMVSILGLALWGLVFWLTYGDTNPNDLLIHLGKTGVTLTFITVLGGLVREVFREREESQRKEEETLDFYRAVLNDFKSVYDRVESTRLLVEAHRSAKTYGEQVRGLIEGVVTLHNIKRALNPEFENLGKELEEPIKKMTSFLKALLLEFRDEYKAISDMQAADEAWNKYQRDELPKKNMTPELYEPISRSWAEIQKLPKLAALRDDTNHSDYESNFLKYLDEASEALRKRLPVGE